MSAPHRLVGFAFAFVLTLVLAGCQGSNDIPTTAQPRSQPQSASNPKPPEPLTNTIAADKLADVMKATREGLGLMEQYRYGEAAEQFRRVRELAPGWIPGSINLAIALLNDTGAKAEDAKKSGGEGGVTSSNFTEALKLLDEAIEREPKNLNARFCRGIILKYLSGDPDHPDNIVRAHEDFQVVVDNDPGDGHAWYKLGDSLFDPESVKSEFGARPAGIKQAKELIEIYSKAMERNPYLVSNLYQLQQAYGWAGDRDRQQKMLALWRKLNPQGNAAAPGDIVGNFYGDMGKYAQVINPFGADIKPSFEKSDPPRFEPPTPIDVSLAEGHRWVKNADFTGPLAPLGKARARFGAAVAVLDVDKDGKLDLFLAAAVVGPKGVHDVLLLNKGDGKFEDITTKAGLSDSRASLGVAAADFDADLFTDLFLTGLDGNALLRSRGRARFEDVSKAAGIENNGTVSLTARWLDLDQDGDLDLYVLNHCSTSDAANAFGEKAVAGAHNLVFRNDGKPAAIANRPADNWAPLAAATGDLKASDGLSLVLTPWTGSEILAGPVAPYSGIAALDVDNDRDLDLILTADDKPPMTIINDRLGAFHLETAPSFKPAARLSGLASVDIDKDGLIDLVAPAADSASTTAWLNKGARGAEGFKPNWASFPISLPPTATLIAADLDLDTWTDLITLPRAGKSIDWARNTQKRFEPAAPLSLGPDSEAALTGLGLANLTGDGLPDVIMLRDGEAPRVAANRGNGNRWVALQLGGKWKTSHDHMRTNSEGIGARLTLEGDGLLVPFSHTVPDASLSQSSQPVTLGLGMAEKVSLLHVLWPDGVMQGELGLDTNVTLPLVEYNRKTGSCPVLFTWNGERFVCLGDFLGGGGLGYLVAPGVYSQPDRDEALAIAPDQLKPVDGFYRISITEPMDEVAYLDHLMLEVVDRPPGTETLLDERFAPEGPRPSGQLMTYRHKIEPVRVTDHRGVDRTATLKAWDRNTADGFNRLRGWIGYAEDHAIIIDFGDRLSKYPRGTHLALALAGWVEYPYSQTNYAAATAGLVLRPPVLERRKADGTWQVINPSPGYPAGLPRMMSIDMTGLVDGAECVLRIKTNMECYWDQAFMAVVEKDEQVVTSRLPVSRAKLGPRGYTREISPDGRLPLLYDYDYVDPAPLAKLSGNLTKFGDVAALLQADDDRFCLIGPGDEARVEFDSRSLPALAPGWTRSYVLRTYGYCKDADPLTATSDTVGPLPWKNMPTFPFVQPASRPFEPSYQEHLDRDQTRPVGRK